MEQAFYSTVVGDERTSSSSTPPAFDSRIVLPVLCAASLVPLLVTSSFTFVRRRLRGGYKQIDEDAVLDVDARTSGLVQRNGGRAALSWGIARALGLVALVIFGARDVVLAQHPDWSVTLELASFSYTLLLSLLSIAFPATPSFNSTWLLRPSLMLLLFSAIVVYFVRDGGPLWSFSHPPLDAWTTTLIVKLAILAAVAVLPPLFTPQTYVPTRAGDLPTEEETASVFSKLFFAYRDVTVFKASRAETLELADLPPLMHCEEATYLKENFMKWVDPKSPVAKKNVLFGIVRIWWRDLLWSQVALAVFSLFNFANILGTNRLLASIEKPEDAVVRPWVWLVLLGAGPSVATQAVNLWQYFSSRPTRQAEALLLQLFFDHSLRLRLNDTSTDKESTDADQKKKKASIVGRISSLMSSDLGTIMNLRMVPYLVGDPIFGSIVSGSSLYFLLGYSSFVAMGLTFLIMPLEYYVAVLQWKIQRSFSSTTDDRVDKVTEALNGLRTTKMLGLENQVKKELTDVRNTELKLIRKSRLIGIISNVVEGLFPTIVSITTLAVYSLVQKRSLNASTIFTAIGLLTRFSDSSSTAMNAQGFLVAPLVALKRVNDFLWKSPLIDELDEDSDETWTGFRGGAAFSWYSELPEDSTLHNFRFSTNKDLIFPEGKISIVTGPTSAGKTSLLMALLGEMHFEKTPGSSFNLPRKAGISYVHQQSWNLNSSVRDNIVFDGEYDQARYEEVLRCCALEEDLKLWAAGDKTQVGEKGITLSGGQRARITLARAIYSKSKLVLIDDCFSALDVQTAKTIVDTCFLGDLVVGRTVILVTHHLTLASAISDFVVKVENGVVISQETVERSKPVSIEKLVKDLEGDDVPELDTAEKLPLPAASGKLVVDEEKALGRVTWPIVKLLVSAFGGPVWWVCFWLAALVMYTEGIVTNWWFATWSRAYETTEHVDVKFYLGVYAVLAVVLIINNGLDSYLRLLGVQSVGRKIHEQMLDSIMGCTLRYLDTVPQGRIIGRFTKDIRLIDRQLPYSTLSLIGRPVSLIMQLLTVLISAPLLSAPTVLVAVGAGTIAKLYLGAQRSVKREQSNLQTPVFTLYGDALAGLSSIRAFSAGPYFRLNSVARVDAYHRATACFHSLNRWSSSRFDLLSTLFALCLGFYLVYGAGEHDASRVGFLLSISQGIVMQVTWILRMQADWEIEMNAVERVHDILAIDHEPASTAEHTPPAAWPTSGALEVKNLTARYSPDSPVVLDRISFSIASGERIGVVGRTGSGKSTLTLSLLRLIPTEGEVLFDGRDIETVNLDSLRTNITIIPQDPSLASGTIRRNIDPFGAHDDAYLNFFLRSVGLLKTGELTVSGATTPRDGASTPNKAPGLDSVVAAGGENLSQGTRQLVALARGLCRRSKIYLFDESTASVDYDTDRLIQQTLNTELKDFTLITIAHRLRTIVGYDRILVLDAGKVVEFDSPTVLLGKEGGYLKALVDASSDAAELYEMARAGKV